MKPEIMLRASGDGKTVVFGSDPLDRRRLVVGRQLV